MFNILPKDNKLIDLITYVGDPFPLEGDDETVCSLEDDDSTNSRPSNLSPLVRVIIEPHEGVPASCPFSIHPKQIVRLLIYYSNHGENVKLYSNIYSM